MIISHRKHGYHRFFFACTADSLKVPQKTQKLQKRLYGCNQFTRKARISQIVIKPVRLRDVKTHGKRKDQKTISLCHLYVLV